jgi:TolB protein
MTRPLTCMTDHGYRPSVPARRLGGVMSSRARRAIIVAVAVCTSSFPLAGTASATFPGMNGRIAWNGDLAIYTVAPDGSDRRLLTEGGYPAWSPNAGRVAFARRPPHSNLSQIFVINADGTAEQQLTDQAESYDPAWSPDAKRIVFVRRKRHEIDDDIFVMNADGSHQRPLTRNDDTYESGPVWSPDGDRIAYSRTRSGDAEILTMNPNGGDKIRLTQNDSDDYNACWSADGNHIAFTSNEDGDSEIFVMNSDGSDRQQLTHNSANDGEPAFSPDGTKIVFARRNGELTNANLFVMDADGGNVARLVGSRRYDISPDWGVA